MHNLTHAMDTAHPLLLRALLFLNLSFLLIGCSSNTRRNRNDLTTPTETVLQQATQKPIEGKTALSIRPKLYLEHSGSMFGYDGPTVNGNFRRTIVSLLNTFPAPQSTPLFIVNDKVYPYRKSYTDLIKSANLFQSTIGNTAYTDFGQLFTTITTDLRENELAILTTDLIYSDAGAGGQLAGRVAATAQSLATLALKAYAKDGALLVWQLDSEFSGQYYPFNSPNRGQTYRGNRPVYLLFFARNATMNRLLTDPAYTTLRTMSRYPGYKNALLFSSKLLNQTPFYTIDESDPDAKGSFDNDREGNYNHPGVVHAVKNLEPPRRSNERMTLSVAVALPMPSDPAWLDTKSYVIESIQDGFQLKPVKLAEGRTDGATHRLLLEATRFAGSSTRTVLIRAKRRSLPGWVAATTTLDDTHPNANTSFARQTFALQPLLMGVQEAYDAYAPDKNYYFTCSLYLKN